MVKTINATGGFLSGQSGSPPFPLPTIGGGGKTASHRHNTLTPSINRGGGVLDYPGYHLAPDSVTSAILRGYQLDLRGAKP